MNHFPIIFANCQTALRMIDNQLDFQNSPKVFERLKRAFANHIDLNNDDGEWVFTWRWRDLGYHDKEQYSSSDENAFLDRCKAVEKAFKEITAEATIFISTSREYGTLTIRVPKSVDLVKQKIEKLHQTVKLLGMRALDTDKVINVDTKYIVTNKAASEEFLSRIEQVVALCGFVPQRIGLENGIQINIG